MKDIVINGKKYRWLYKERDGSHWYIPKNSKDGGFNVKGYLLTQEELKSKYGIIGA